MISIGTDESRPLSTTPSETSATVRKCWGETQTHSMCNKAIRAATRRQTGTSSRRRKQSAHRLVQAHVPTARPKTHMRERHTAARASGLSIGLRTNQTEATRLQDGKARQQCGTAQPARLGSQGVCRHNTSTTLSCTRGAAADPAPDHLRLTHTTCCHLTPASQPASHPGNGKPQTAH